MTLYAESDEPVALRWSQSKGWIRFQDPATGEWYEAWSRDLPNWRAVLIQRLRDEGRLGSHHHADADDDNHDTLDCGCTEEHDPCVFGRGLDCLNGPTCPNPHHIGQRPRQPHVKASALARPAQEERPSAADLAALHPSLLEPRRVRATIGWLAQWKVEKVGAWLRRVKRTDDLLLLREVLRPAALDGTAPLPNLVLLDLLDTEIRRRPPQDTVA